jgi:hypothetical protein
MGRQLGRGPRYNFKHPSIKVARQALYFLIAGIVKGRDGPQRHLLECADQCEAAGSLVGRLNLTGV